MSQNSPTPYRVVVAIDFSALADRALEHALLLCEKHASSELHLIVVGWDEPGGVRLPGPTGQLLLPGDAEQAVCEHANRVIVDLQQQGHDFKSEKIAIYVATGEPAERICALASSLDADLIVVGTHGRTGLSRWILGSVAEEVVRRAPCAVWVIRPRDFLGGEKLPAIEPPLRPGEQALHPFHHRPTYHYVRRPDRAAGHVMPIA